MGPLPRYNAQSPQHLSVNECATVEPLAHWQCQQLWNQPCSRLANRLPYISMYLSD